MKILLITLFASIALMLPLTATAATDLEDVTMSMMDDDDSATSKANDIHLPGEHVDEPDHDENDDDSTHDSDDDDDDANEADHEDAEDAEDADDANEANEVDDDATDPASQGQAPAAGTGGA